jgi:hypothetical protein
MFIQIKCLSGFSCHLDMVGVPSSNLGVTTNFIYTIHVLTSNLQIRIILFCGIRFLHITLPSLN